MTEVSAQQNLFDLGKDLPLYEQHTDAQQNVWFELKTTTHSDLSGDVPSRCVLSPSGLSAMVDYKQGLGQA